MKLPFLAPTIGSDLQIKIATGFFLFIVFLNTIAMGYQARLIFPPKPVEKAYTYEGHDYPRELHLDLGAPVALTVDDTEHLQIATPEAEAEWYSIMPPGYGFIHLGPNKRRFATSMFHQIHCLNVIRNAILAGASGDHVHHCFNYLRQMALCHADLTLEEGVPELGIDPTGELPVNGVGITHTCKDWSKVYTHLADEYYNFNEWRKTHNVTSF
ncbi:hypothetical protein DACRYDRAFT_106484 [Dacryopinax primogenitus]|uniref:Oxidase ustYa n=1 Tax=Dacryopinax primogenitus (strain DJM 731) TaxID=1858805 RepID=M5G525_DACPD|nr:uncharacterized protein DACRYDRAFT_106484 [Dacryopinax primogenitus]EJU03325.1 hypothetical protein DACRYDRAFT_106484 [Dacryopinax primogenitus]